MVLKIVWFLIKVSALREGSMAYQLVGKVMAYQGYDGYRVWEHDPAHWDWDTAQTPTGGCSQEYSSMGESLKERRRVYEEAFRGVKYFY